VDTVRQALASVKTGGEKSKAPVLAQAQTPSKAKPNSKINSLELQIFALYIQSEQVRPLLGKAFVGIKFSDETNAKIAKTLVEASAQSDTSITQYLYTNLPEASIVNEVLTDSKIAEPTRLANLMLWQLKIAQLNAEIKATQADLNNNDAFARVAKLQQELSHAHKKYAQLEGPQNT
jgi:hypothetical protein